MAQEKPTLGSAIDQIVQALEKLDAPARLTALRAVCSHLSIDLGGAPSEGGAVTPQLLDLLSRHQPVRRRRRARLLARASTFAR